MKLHEEFKLFESMWDAITILDEAKKLTETRSIADIEAEIARLERDLAKAKAELVAAKKAGLKGKRPKYVYTFDVYIEPENKGSWPGAEYDNGDWDGAICETEAEAIELGRDILADNPEMLEGPIEDYTIDTIAIPIDEISDDQLEYLGLAHLIK